MTRLSIQGTVSEFPLGAVAIWATSVLVNPIEIVGTLHWAQNFAMPGKANEVYIHEIDEILKQLRINAEIVDDPRLAHAICRVFPSLEAFASSAKEIREWQETHVPKKIRTVHNKVVRERGPIEPPWHDDEQFRKVFQKSSDAFSLYLDTLRDSIDVIRAISSIDVTLSEQLTRAEKQVPFFRMVLQVGYAEVARRNSTIIGSSLSA